jgi:hypothetical protein
MAHAYLVTSLDELGDLDAAEAAARRLLEVAPDFSVEGFARMDLFRAPLMAAIARALRRAGLPDEPGDKRHARPRA